LRVLWVTDVFPHAGRPYKGAWLVDLARALSRSAEIVVLSPRYRFLWTPGGSFLEWYRGQPPVVDHGGVRTLYPPAPAVPWAFTMAVQSVSMAHAFLPVARREHLRRRFDLVHGHFIIPGGVAAAWIARRLSLPLVVTAHGSDVNVFSRVRHLRPFFNTACGRAAGITAVSRDLVSSLERLGFGGARWIPAGCLMGDVDPTARVKGRILFVGQLWEWKGPEVLLEAFAKVKREVPDATLDLAGEGEDASRLRERASSLGFGSAVRFLGPVPHEQMMSLMGQADVFCLPSRREGLPVSVIEAFAAGAPVVGSAVGGMGELVHGPELGFLVPPGDAAALAEALLRALRTPWDRERIRTEADGYDLGRIAVRYLDVYREVIASRRIRSSSVATAGAE